MSSLTVETGGNFAREELRSDEPRLAMPSKDEDPAVIAGWWLHNERMKNGVALTEAARAARIDPIHLDAIETGKLDRLPERGLALDIIWAYADYLKLEPGPLCAHFGRLLPKEAPRQLKFPQTSKFNGTGIMAKFALPKITSNPMTSTVLACFMALGAFSYMGFLVSETPEDNKIKAKTLAVDKIITSSVKKLPEQNTKAVSIKGSQVQGLEGLDELIARTAVKEAATAPTEKNSTRIELENKPIARKISLTEQTGGRLYGAENKNSRVTIEAKSRVWIRIEDDNGNVILNHTLLSGDMFKVPNRKGLVLIARDGGVLSYFLDGKHKGLIGTVGEILIGHSLDPEKIGQLS